MRERTLYKIYGKHAGPLLQQKVSFFRDNDRHVEKQRSIAELYAQQPRRKACKNCDHALHENVDFTKDGIGYQLCSTCGHLNGIHEDTSQFCEFVYSSGSGKKYAENYEVGDFPAYSYRQSSIYAPKAEFLFSSLTYLGGEPHSLRYLDFGCGSGYFVGALHSLGLRDVSGTEVSDYQCEFGNKMLGREALSTHRLDQTGQILANTDADVVSFVGVLEHLYNPREAISSLSNNENVQYVFLSVPLYSPSVFFEMI
jgi:hypothetical protein